MNARIAAGRLANQGIDTVRATTPQEVVAWFGGVQAQDIRAALWAIGLRLPDGATAAIVQRALDDGRILRTHVLRPTWHFVTASDSKWMLELTAPQVQRRLATYYRQLGLDEKVRSRGAKVIERALASGDHLTRAEIAAALARAGLPLSGVRLAVLTLHVELERIICSGRQRGAQATYALLSDRAPRPVVLARDEALAELSRRYLRSHGPATIRDFVWWSGLSTADARRGFASAGARDERIGDHVYWRVDDAGTLQKPSSAVHLLPIYDEYLVAYRDLQAVPRPPSTWGLLPQSIVAKGQVAGTWKAVRHRDGVDLLITNGRALTASESRGLAQAARRYGRFFGVPHSLRRNETDPHRPRSS